MQTFDLGKEGLRALNSSLHALKGQTNMTAWEVINPKGAHAIAAGVDAHVIDRPGGIFIRPADQISSEDRILFQTVARAILSDSRGTLAEQLNRRGPLEIVPTYLGAHVAAVTTLFRGEFRDVCRQAFRDHRDLLEPYFSLAAIERLFGEIGRSPTWLRLPEQQLFHAYLFLRWHQVFIGGAVPATAGDPAAPPVVLPTPGSLPTGSGACSGSLSGRPAKPRTRAKWPRRARMLVVAAFPRQFQLRCSPAA